MANMLGKRAQQRYGYAGRHCQCCSIDKVVREQKHSTRQAEKAAWREDVRDLPQGESWLNFMLEVPSFGGVRNEELSFWEAMDQIEEIHEDYPTPPGFDGSWSTGDAHVLLMNKRHRMERVHESLWWLELAHEGRWYAREMVRLPQFERVVS